MLSTNKKLLNIDLCSCWEDCGDWYINRIQIYVIKLLDLFTFFYEKAVVLFVVLRAMLFIHLEK
jgi:hypothetical protein